MADQGIIWGEISFIDRKPLYHGGQEYENANDDPVQIACKLEDRIWSRVRLDNDSVNLG